MYFEYESCLLRNQTSEDDSNFYKPELKSELKLFDISEYFTVICKEHFSKDLIFLNPYDI